MLVLNKDNFMIKNYDDEKLNEIIKTRTKKGLIVLVGLIIVLIVKLIIN